jgi:hypothetical protein
MSTIYRGYDVHKDAGGYFFKNDSGFQSGYYPTEDKALDAIDAMHRERAKREAGAQ